MFVCPILVYAGFEVFLVFRLPSTSIYGSFKLFWMGVFHQIPVWNPNNKKKSFLQNSLCRFLVAPLLSNSLYGLFKRFCMGVFHPFQFWLSPLPPPTIKKWKRKTVLFTAVCTGFEVFLVILMPSTSIYGLFKWFCVGILHQIPVWLAPRPSPPNQKIKVFFKTVCAGFEVGISGCSIAFNFLTYLNWFFFSIPWLSCHLRG